MSKGAAQDTVARINSGCSLAARSERNPPRLDPRSPMRPSDHGCFRAKLIAAFRSYILASTRLIARLGGLSPHPEKSNRRAQKPALLTVSPMATNLGLSLALRRPWEQTITGAGTFPGRCTTAERSIPSASISNSFRIANSTGCESISSQERESVSLPLRPVFETNGIEAHPDKSYMLGEVSSIKYPSGIISRFSVQNRRWPSGSARVRGQGRGYP